MIGKIDFHLHYNARINENILTIKITNGLKKEQFSIVGSNTINRLRKFLDVNKKEGFLK